MSSLHLELEQRLDDHRRRGTKEAVIQEALLRALRFSAVLVRAAELSGGDRRR